ncbi:MAG: hypothetical protein HY545_02695 [Candidatus Doudnabacteria bacterium]|nr:hypothetical protein [Candidatus Doudnabacteria bacterium]
MDQKDDGAGVCGMADHEEMMKTDPEGFKKHLQEVHGGNDPHQHDMPGVI